MRAILDPNVIIAAVLSPQGAPARVLRSWLEGQVELLASPALLGELERALSYPKLRERIRPPEASQLVEWLEREATVVPDPEKPPAVRSADPGDDYLLALAEGGRAVLISGDHHLLALREDAPILSPRQFLEALQRD